MSDQPSRFRVRLTADFYSGTGEPKFQDMGLSVFEKHPHIQCSAFAEHRKQIGRDQIGDANGLIVLTPAVTQESIAGADELLAIGRFGVGYDAVDVEACTGADVAVFITAGAVDRSVAEATVGWMIALSHRVLAKDRLVRTGRWDERTGYMGCELRDRTFGAVGLGGIARETIRLLEGFAMRRAIAFDPFVSDAEARSIGVTLVGLDELMAKADFVSVHCPLTRQTRGLIGPAQVGLMPPGSYLINTARGGIVDEDALYEALKARRIAGAALDCFTDEPVTTPSRFAALDNVLLAPHSIAWTHELFRDIGTMACQGMVELSMGRVPRGVVNPEVLDRATFQEKWDRLVRREGTTALKG